LSAAHDPEARDGRATRIHQCRLCIFRYPVCARTHLRFVSSHELERILEACHANTAALPFAVCDTLSPLRCALHVAISRQQEKLPHSLRRPRRTRYFMEIIATQTHTHTHTHTHTNIKECIAKAKMDPPVHTHTHLHTHTHTHLHTHTQSEIASQTTALSRRRNATYSQMAVAAQRRVFSWSALMGCSTCEMTMHERAPASRTLQTM
jgi:hypothetical protein